MLKLVQDASARAEQAPTTVGLDELCRLAAQEMLTVALLAERRAYLDAHADLVDKTGKRLVVGNGYAKEREVTTGAGMVEVKAPRVDDRREGQHYRSVILPAYMRKSPKVTEVLPVLYLRGLSTGDFAPALGEFFGSGAGLSASTVARLTEAWQDERERWAGRDLSGTDYVYWWADGVHFNVRLEEDRLCCLVVVGVRPDGTKELVALADGYRESKESWAGPVAQPARARPGRPGPGRRRRGARLLGRPQRRLPSHQRTEVLGAQDRERSRCVTKTPSPQSQICHPGHLQRRVTDGRPEAAKSFADTFAGFPKATAKIMDELDTLLAFFDFPKEHWVHLRTSNPIESTFSTVRLRTKVTRGAGSRRAGPGHGLQAPRRRPGPLAQDNRSQLVPLVRAGATFIDGKLQERRPAETEPDI